MEKKNKQVCAMDIALLALALILFIGLMTFLKPCGPKEDGSWMSCYWAGQALKGTTGAMVLLALVRLSVRGEVKIGLDIGSAVLAILSVLIPGRLIGLCMMDAMRCHAVMTPGVTVLSILTIAAAATDIILRRNKNKA